jgi:hypothetical protein
MGVSMRFLLMGLKCTRDSMLTLRAANFTSLDIALPPAKWKKYCNVRLKIAQAGKAAGWLSDKPGTADIYV